MTTGPVGIPQSVRASVGCWLTAVAAGVVETAIHLLADPGSGAAVQIPIRIAVYGVVTVVILALRCGRAWARIVLTVLLGGVGLFSLLAEPISWWVSGGAPAAFLAAADATTLAVVAVRAVHVLAVLVGLVLMYRPQANRFFRPNTVEEKVS
ncbi:hypothetical protein ACWDTP_30080 [Mycobacterium sp. NPDC003449]